MVEVNPWPELIEAYVRGERPRPPRRLELAWHWARGVIQGPAFENRAARLGHAAAGLWLELKPPREGFFAFLGPVVGEYLPPRAARRLLWEGLSLAERQGWALWVEEGRLGALYFGRGEAAGVRTPELFLLEAGRRGVLALKLGGEHLVFHFVPGRPVLEGAAA